MPRYKDQGLLTKYDLVRTDGRDEDSGARTFVLRYDKDSAWCAAMREIIKETVVPRVQAMGYDKLAQELTADVARIEAGLAETHLTAPIEVPEL